MKHLIVFLAIVLICSCGPGDIQKEYAQKAREIGLVPVYPPREEFQVGDIYAWSKGVDANGRIDPNDVVRVWISSNEALLTMAEEHLKTRVAFRESRSSIGDVQIDTYGNGIEVRGKLRIETLPIAAFPSITGDSGLSVGAGVVKALQAVGLAGGTRTTVTMDFDDVRTYWLPKVNVTDEMLIPILNSYSDNKSAIDSSLNAALETATFAGRSLSKDRCLGFSIVTRVYLTRKITYRYLNSRIASAGIRRATEGANLASVPAAPRVTVINTNAESGTIQTSDPQADLTSLRTQLDSLGSDESRGKGLNFEAWDATGLSLSRSFARPVAIGWDGYELSSGNGNNPSCQ